MKIEITAYLTKTIYKSGNSEKGGAFPLLFKHRKEVTE